jgi:hypothetical protein
MTDLKKLTRVFTIIPQGFFSVPLFLVRKILPCPFPIRREVQDL